MCYKAPGPRCSSHAEKRLDRLVAVESNTAGQLRATYASYKQAVIAFRENPEDKNAAKKAKALHKKTRLLKEKAKGLNAEVRSAQRDYDGTRKGQAALEKKISEFDKVNGDFEDYASLNTRLSSGKMFYSWRKNQLKLQEDEATTGKTLKERRGKFLTFSDRDGTEEFETDPVFDAELSDIRPVPSFA